MTSLSQAVPTLLTNLRDAALASYATVADAPLPVPTPVLHHDGPAPTIDLPDLLVIMATNLTSAFQGTGEECAVALQVGLSVTVTRKVANLAEAGGLRQLDDYSQSTLTLAGDASTLWFGLTQAWQAGTLWQGFSGLSCGDTKWRDMRPGVGGGLGWWTFPLTVNVVASLL
jgi:hypothetical protein